MGRFLGKRKQPCCITGGRLSAQLRSSLIGYILVMIACCQSNLRVTWVPVGRYRPIIDRLTSAFTLLRSRVVDNIVCVSIKRVQRYFASAWSVPSAAAENCTELATWRSCLVSPFFFAFQSVSLILVLFNLFLLVQIRIWKCKGNLLCT